MLHQGKEECDEQWQRAMDYISQVSELNYMAQVVIMLYEDPTKDPSSEQRYFDSVSLLLSHDLIECRRC